MVLAADLQMQAHWMQTWKHSNTTAQDESYQHCA